MTGSAKKIRKPKPWKHPQPITKSQLIQMREEFWDTSPHYGGRKEIWDALQAAAEAELSLAQAIVDSAGVIIQNADLTVCYDERGAKYELPKYVLRIFRHGVKVKELDYVLPKTTEIMGVILANRKGILGQSFYVQDHRFMGSSGC
ncbi:BINDING PROTEIN putative-RELATED [Salix purpurea]|uniref:BINDING PROTEIN putative-RELATED n=1 Tax=Salix purpurea TaxID=77065 RepID=A0A9Q0VSH3_SALPP|nr:BINDING PROTEIN putative-RELATED [Salix purpurea]